MNEPENMYRLDDYRPRSAELPAYDEAALIRQANTILLQLDGNPEALAAWTEKGRQIIAGRPVSA